MVIIDCVKHVADLNNILLLTLLHMDYTPRLNSGTMPVIHHQQGGNMWRVCQERMHCCWSGTGDAEGGPLYLCIRTAKMSNDAVYWALSSIDDLLSRLSPI